jgi:hypothetical protein
MQPREEEPFKTKRPGHHYFPAFPCITETLPRFYFAVMTSQSCEPYPPLQGGGTRRFPRERRESVVAAPVKRRQVSSSDYLKENQNAEIVMGSCLPSNID